MKKNKLHAEFLLLVAALIWGFAFVAQKLGAEHVGAFTFNGLRFLLGAWAVYLMLLWENKIKKKQKIKLLFNKQVMMMGFIVGIILAVAASLQQIGIETTTAGKAGFITGLYIVFAPLISLLIGKKPPFYFWAGLLITLVGLYLLCFQLNRVIFYKGDILIILSALFFAVQIVIIGEVSPKVDSLALAFVEILSCGIFCLIIALWKENIIWQDVKMATLPILYAGILSIGLAFSLQIKGQKTVVAYIAALIMSLETVFAVLGGWLVLNERMSHYEILGCLLMFIGIVVSQIRQDRKKYN